MKFRQYPTIGQDLCCTVRFQTNFKKHLYDFFTLPPINVISKKIFHSKSNNVPHKRMWFRAIITLHNLRMQLIRRHHQTVIHSKFLILQQLFFLTHISIQLLSWHHIINFYNPTKSQAFHSHFLKNRSLNKINQDFQNISSAQHRSGMLEFQ